MSILPQPPGSGRTSWNRTSFSRNASSAFLGSVRFTADTVTLDNASSKPSHNDEMTLTCGFHHSRCGLNLQRCMGVSSSDANQYLAESAAGLRRVQRSKQLFLSLGFNQAT